MNIVLVDQDDFIDEHTVYLTDRRFEHINKIHKVVNNSSLRIGIINGLRGRAKVVCIDHKSVTLNVTIDTPTLPVLPLTLLLALPRPKMLKRILQCVASLGVKEIYLLNSYKVEKSYWSSPVLADQSINEHLRLGLEQAGDTIMPNVHLCKRFKPFVEDLLPTIACDSKKIVAHPYQAKPISEQNLNNDQKTTLAIGPEGGFIDYEVDKLKELGFSACSLGERILRVETAIPYCIAKLYD